MMKKLFLLFVLMGAMPLSMMAQDDDLYFVPSKNKAEKTSSAVEEKPAYYVGSNRDVDEYNRRGKYRDCYRKIGVDSLGNDIIEFQAGTGEYPDTLYLDSVWVAQKKGQRYDDDDDYSYSRRMSRWDGYYGWYDPWYFGRWGWHPFGYSYWYEPWYYYGAYGGWYDWWYDPWYYAHYGWGYPYYGYYGRYGWGYPYYYGGAYYGGGYAYNGVTGTRRHGSASYDSPRGVSNGRTHSFAHGTFGGSRSGSFGSRGTVAASSRGTRATSRTNSGTYSNSHGNFGGSSYTPSHSSSSGSYSAPSYSSGSSGGGGSYSGGGGGGGTFGGSRSGGGGGGGGGGFGGRR